jgi:hypothetical protein
MLRSEGVLVQAFVPFDDDLDLHQLLDHYPDFVDTWEVQTAGEALPTSACLDLIADCDRRTRLSLSTIAPGERIPGKQHPRTRLGYRLEDLASLNHLLAERDLTLNSALCRIDGEDGPWAMALRFCQLPALYHISRIDWLLTLPGLDDRINANLAAEALFATALMPDTRLYVDPPLDLDRTMDVRHGLLDVLCNPRPAFNALRCLNTLLYVHRGEWAPEERGEDGVRVLGLRSEERGLELLLPAEPVEWTFEGDHLYHLETSTVETKSGQVRIDGPALVCV